MLPILVALNLLLINRSTISDSFVFLVGPWGMYAHLKALSAADLLELRVSHLNYSSLL